MLSVLALGLSVTTHLSAARPYPHRPIVLVCPWAAGGGTDIVSRNVAAHLETQLHVPVNVINATGGKGVTGHSRGLRARPDGYTLTMITLELNMMHWSGLTSLTVADCEPLVSLNEDYAALFVLAGAPWKTLPELEQAIRAYSGPAGGVGHRQWRGLAPGRRWVARCRRALRGRRQLGLLHRRRSIPAGAHRRWTGHGLLQPARSPSTV